MARYITATAAITFAKTYTQLVEALMREGVEEETAREEAHLAAVELMHIGDYRPETGEPCPACGRR